MFAHLTHAIGLKRFSLRGSIKVNIQWKLFCIVHNLTKIHRYCFSSGRWQGHGAGCNAYPQRAL